MRVRVRVGGWQGGESSEQAEVTLRHRSPTIWAPGALEVEPVTESHLIGQRELAWGLGVGLSSHSAFFCLPFHSWTGSRQETSAATSL